MAESQSALANVAERVRNRMKREQEKIDIQKTKKEAEKAHSEYLLKNYDGPINRIDFRRPNLAHQEKILEQRKCPIIGCDIVFTNDKQYKLHISATDACAHSPCNPIGHLPNARLHSNTTGQVCPVCGELYRNFESCLQHMQATQHIILQEPLELTGYICPQCLQVYPDQSSCGEHMASENHRYVQYPFENDLDPGKKVLPVPLPKETLLLYLEKCASVECNFINKTTVKAESNHGEAFALLLKSTTCIQCLRLFDDLSHNDVIHQCSNDIQGFFIDNNCKTFEEFLRRLALKPIPLKKSNKELVEDIVVISDEDDDIVPQKAHDVANGNVMIVQNANSSTENNDKRKKTKSGGNKEKDKIDLHVGCTNNQKVNNANAGISTHNVVNNTVNKEISKTIMNTSSQVQNTKWKKISSCRKIDCVCEILQQTGDVSSPVVCVSTEESSLDFVEKFSNVCLVLDKRSSISKVMLWSIFKKFWYSDKSYFCCIRKSQFFVHFYGLPLEMVKTNKFIYNYKISWDYGKIIPLNFTRVLSVNEVKTNKFNLEEIGNKRKLPTSSVKKSEDKSRKRKNDSAKKNVPSSLNTGHSTVLRRLDFNEGFSPNKIERQELDCININRNQKRRKIIKLVNKESKRERKAEKSTRQENSKKKVHQKENKFPQVYSKSQHAASKKRFSHEVKNFNFAENFPAVFSANPVKVPQLQSPANKFAKHSSKSTHFDSCRDNRSMFLPNNHDKVFSSNIKKVIGTMTITCSNLKDLHLDGNPLLRNRIPDNLHLMDHVIFLDVDNWPAFFQKLPKSLPEKTFVWGFYGGTTVWREPLNCYRFNTIKKNGCFYLHSKCSNRKDAADFAICMWLGRMDERLPKNIPFTILSGDKGFREIEDQMENTERRTVVINPHHETPEGVYSLIISVSQTHVS